MLVPARDEEDVLPGLFRALEGTEADLVMVVDNGSRDATPSVARRLGAEVVFEPRPGYGRACRRGLAHLAARSDPPEELVFMDADDWLAPAQMGRLLGPLREGRAELVIGGRRTPPGGSGVPRHARLGNRAVSAVLRGLYGAPVRDLGPLRASRLALLLDLRLDDPDYGWNVQMEVRALRAGWRLLEVPVLFEGRRAGRSKISGSLGGSLGAARGMISALWREVARAPRG